MMTSFRGRDMVLVECRHVSMSMCMRAKGPDVVCEVIAEIMKRHSCSKAAFVGHSYGTFVLSRMAQLHRDLVESMVSGLYSHGVICSRSYASHLCSPDVAPALRAISPAYNQRQYSPMFCLSVPDWIVPYWWSPAQAWLSCCIAGQHSQQHHWQHVNSVNHQDAVAAALNIMDRPRLLC